DRVVFEGFEGLQLVADVRGDPDAPPVLLLHGGGQTRHAWGTTAERVAARGAVVDQLGRPPVLVGASLGGMSAMLAEGTSDRTVSCGLVLVDITSKSNPEGIQRITSFMQSGLEGFETLE